MHLFSTNAEENIDTPIQFSLLVDSPICVDLYIASDGRIQRRQWEIQIFQIFELIPFEHFFLIVNDVLMTRLMRML